MDNIEIFITILLIALSFIFYFSDRRVAFVSAFSILIAQVLFTVVYYVGRGSINLIQIMEYTTYFFFAMIVVGFVIKNKLFKVISISVTIYLILHFAYLIFSLAGALT